MKTNKKKTIVNAREEKAYNTYCWWECILLKPLWRFIKKLKLPYDQALYLKDISEAYMKECKSIFKVKPCSPMFTVTLYKITKLWNLHRCPGTD
jgi:hypothetical protein